MEELVLKREATVTSADALDQIAESYPGAEILSFRRIKEAGTESEFFITRVRFAADEATDIDDVVVEGKQHEEEEEEKMNEILRLLKKLVGEEEAPETKAAPKPNLNEDHGRAPLPKPQKPPFGVDSLGTGIAPVSSITVERNADIPLVLARVELIRDFSDEYTVQSIDKRGSVYRATLVKKADGGDDAELDRVNQQAIDWRERMQEQERNLVSEQRARSEEILKSNLPPRRDVMKDMKGLDPSARDWIEFMDENNADDLAISQEMETLKGMSHQEQRKFVENALEEWRGGIQKWDYSDEAQGAVAQYGIDGKTLQSIDRRAKAARAANDQAALNQLKTFFSYIKQIPTENQYESFMNLFGQEEETPDYRNYRDVLRRSVQKLPKADAVEAPATEEQLTQPQPQASPYEQGSYGDYIWNSIGPGNIYYNKNRWEKELAEYNANPESFEQGWSGQIKNRVAQ